MGPSEGTPNLQAVDRVLHEPARLQIMGCLWHLEEADFLFLSRQVGLTVGNLSFHLSKLEAAGLVVIRKTFQGKVPRTSAAMTEAGRRALHDYRQTVMGFLQGLGDL